MTSPIAVRSTPAQPALSDEASWSRNTTILTRRYDNAVRASPNSVCLRGATTESFDMKFMCVVCGFIYDEEAGLPREGIEPGTRWEDLPDTWTCPDCSVTKDDFDMIENES
jgi:rubredoxin